MDVFCSVSEELSLVIAGEVAPATFSPDWFVRHGLLPKEDIDPKVCSIEVIHSEFCSFSLSWCEFRATQDRIAINTSSREYADVVKDLGMGIISLLPGMYVGGIGINTIFVESCSNESEFNRIGDLLAPKSVWSEIIPSGDSHALANIHMVTRNPDNQYNEYNSRIKGVEVDSGLGLEFRFNSHFHVSRMIDDEFEFSISKLIDQNWACSIRIAEDAKNNLISV